MSNIALKAEDVSKQYRLGTVGTGTLSQDLNRWFAKVRGKEDPFLKIGETNDRTSLGNSEFVWALKDINFEIKQGDVVGIIGRNGAGKSTLLKLLSKTTLPTTGKIKINGRIASLLEVGTGFHPELTGRDNIFLNGAILGMTKKEIQSKFDEIVDFAGVARYVDTPVKRYSSGMYVRLAFAVAAHLDPDILIVDEVLAVGDAEFQKKAIGKMKSVSEEGGRTVLFVSHNMDSIKKLCNVGIFMENGKIIYSGDINETIKLYNNRITTGKDFFYYNNNNNTKDRISSIYLTDCDNQRITSISVFDERYFLNVEFKIENPFGLCFACTVFTSDGEPLMSSSVLTDIKKVNGEYKAKLELPHRLLKSGEYFLEGAFVGPDGIIELNECFMLIKVESRNRIELAGGKVLGKILNPYEWQY